MNLSCGQASNEPLLGAKPKNPETYMKQCGSVLQVQILCGEIRTLISLNWSLSYAKLMYH